MQKRFVTYIAVISAALAIAPFTAHAEPTGAPANAPAVPPVASPTGTLPAPSRWEKDIQAFEKKDREAPPPTGAALFVGSSSIRLWSTLAKDIPEIPVINRGFGGSVVSDSTHFADRIVLPYKPRLIVMYAGTNDISAGRSPEQVFEDFKAFVARVHASLPETKIAYISINPTIRRWKIDEKMREANRLIRQYTEGNPKLAYIDSYPAMLGSDGMPQQALLRTDNLHLNAEGYKVWTTVVKPRVLKLYEEAAPKTAP